MRNLTLILALFIGFACSQKKTNETSQNETTENINKPVTDTLLLNMDNYTVNWVGKKVTGQHDGKISIKEGFVLMSNGELVGGKIVMDMNSITVEDLKDEKLNKKLLNHLKSDDFFAVDKFPTSELIVKNVTKKESTYQISGDLTIRGITNPITFECTINELQDKYIAKGNIDIDRTLYDVKYGSGKFFQNLGDKLINDIFHISFEVSANKNKKSS